MSLQLDGPVSLPLGEGQHPVTRVAVRMSNGKCDFLPLVDRKARVADALRHVDVPLNAQIITNRDLVMWLMKKGHAWRRRCTADAVRNHTHAYVYDGTHSYLTPLDSSSVSDELPLCVSFCAGPFEHCINRLIEGGEHKARALGDIFLLGMIQPARIH